LAENFRVCPPGADDVIVERFARAWLWHMVGGFLFPDASGNTVSWLMMPFLGLPWDEVATYSWGSATLSFLYRQLCDACTRTSAAPNFGECCYLLQFWMWFRFPIGRPYLGSVPRRLLFYQNELDCITHNQVI
ncbi:hypothetical protein BAE44_0009056, partial [Dichanthelium oligosanthes]